MLAGGRIPLYPGGNGWNFAVVNEEKYSFNEAFVHPPQSYDVGRQKDDIMNMYQDGNEWNFPMFNAGEHSFNEVFVHHTLSCGVGTWKDSTVNIYPDGNEWIQTMDLTLTDIINIHLNICALTFIQGTISHVFRLTHSMRQGWNVYV